MRIMRRRSVLVGLGVGVLAVLVVRRCGGWVCAGWAGGGDPGGARSPPLRGVGLVVGASFPGRTPCAARPPAGRAGASPAPTFPATTDVGGRHGRPPQGLQVPP